MPSQAASQTRSQKRNNNKKRLKNNRPRPRNHATSPGTTHFFWDLEFDHDSVRVLQLENEPFLRSWEEMGPEQSLVRFFMTESRAANRIMPAVELVAGFCPDDTLEKLQSGSSLSTLEKVSLLDDRTNDGAKSVPRDYLGPLDAHALYLQLKEKVRLSCYDCTNACY